MIKIFDYILSLIYPPKCVFCGTVIDKSDICEECEKTLPYTKGDSIYQKFPFVDKCISPLYYKDYVRRAVLRFKFAGCSCYSRRLGGIMSECAENNLDCGSIDMVSCIPLSRKRMHDRGYNQAELLAKEISKKVGVEYLPTLKKIRHNTAQSTIKDSKQRAANVIGAYRVIDAEEVKGKYILLVDDVVTTGSTVSECARILKKSGAKAVYCVTLARHED